MRTKMKFRLPRIWAGICSTVLVSLLFSCGFQEDQMLSAADAGSVTLTPRIVASSADSDVGYLEVNLAESGKAPQIKSVKHAKGELLTLGTVTKGAKFSLTVIGYDSITNRVVRFWAKDTGTAGGEASQTIQVNVVSNAMDLGSIAADSLKVGGSLNLNANDYYTTNGDDPRVSGTQATDHYKFTQGGTVKVATKLPADAATGQPELWSAVKTFVVEGTSPVVTANDTLLASLTVVGKLTPVFTLGVTTYDDTIDAGMMTETITAAARDATHASVTGGGAIRFSKDTTAKIQVSNGGSSLVYTVNIVHRAAAKHDTTLAKLSGTRAFDSAFSGGRLTYIDTVAAAATTETPTAVANDSAHAVVTGAGLITLTGNLTVAEVTVKNGDFNLTYTVNIIKRGALVVVRPDSALKTLTATSLVSTVNRYTQFYSNVYEYDDSVAWNVKTETFVATAKYSGAKIAYNGVMSGVINVASGNVNVSIVSTVDTNGVKTASTYLIHVIHRSPPHDTTLSQLVVSNGKLTPGFRSDITQYFDTVPASITVESFTPVANAYSNATIGCMGCSNSQSPFAVALGPVGSAVSSKNVTFTVANGNRTLDYMVTVVRLAPVKHDTTLRSLVLSVGTLSPPFDPAHQDYTLNLPYDSNIVKFTATSSDPKATVAGSGMVDTWLSFDLATIPAGESTPIMKILVTNNGVTLSYSFTINKASTP